MAEPNTLRALSGLPLEPARLGESVLVLIDCQNTYTEGVLELDGVQAALDEAAVLLERARSAGAPVIHVQHDDGPGSLYDINGHTGAIVDRVAPLETEPIVVKNYPNAFVQTELQDRLASLGVQNLVLAGFMTHMCVNSTARGAFNLGYAPTVVANATATRALPGVDREPVSASAIQAASLAAIADLFAVVVPDAADIPG
ncbi:cysteine hydrolase family protein [Mycobacterium kyogaense]|uniref:cysteine hydrolase family protein n=1 Tax=Mycobacterium kyogaense TaxID=2212479 RepID=UPI000DAB9F69|nr:cysteine hydrolase family protein [Mycobacterium kyogaense]